MIINTNSAQVQQSLNRQHAKKDYCSQWRIQGAHNSTSHKKKKTPGVNYKLYGEAHHFTATPCTDVASIDFVSIIQLEACTQ